LGSRDVIGHVTIRRAAAGLVFHYA